MNLPNKLTLTRIALIPVMVLLYAQEGTGWMIAAAAVFAAAALTDALDGHIARSRGLVTNFGKFLDPLADKLLVLSAFVMLCEKGLLPSWCVLTVLARELAVDGLRMIAVGNGQVIAASPLGKVKTVVQMMLVLWLTLSGQAAFSHWAGIVLTIAAVGMTLLSGIDYFRRNRNSLAA